MTLHSCRQTILFQMFQFLCYRISHLNDVRTAGGRHQQSQCLFAIIKQFIAGGLLITFFYSCDITQAQLVIIMPLNQHISNIVHRFKLIIDRYTDTVISILIVSCIGRFVLSVQCGKHFGRLHS